MTELGVPGAALATDAALAALRGAVTGPVFGPDDVGLVTELAGFNLALEHAPLAVVGATSAEDIAAAVRWAAGQGVRVGVLATGHGDLAQRGTLAITTRRMDRVHVEPATRRATVGAGVKWARLVEAAAPYGLAGLNGSSTDVGIAGYTTGGGVGPFVRKYGYASDRVRRVRVVTGDGEIRDVTAASDPELFDVVLGGKDAVGIVAELEFALIEVPRMYGGGLMWGAADIPAVLRAWQEWAPTLPEEMTTSVAILRAPDVESVPAPLRGRTLAHLRVAHLGSADEGRALLGPMRAVATPVMDTVDEMSYAAIDAVHMDPTDPMPFWADGCFLADLDADAVDAVLAAAGPQQEIPLILVELRHLAGAAERGTRGLAPRDARFMVGVVGPLVPALREVVPAVARGVVEALTPWAASRTGLNWVNPYAVAARPELAWSPVERRRIEAVRRRVDPHGVLGAVRLGV
ncbi:FAD-binding oxidoreductase [Actinomycetospora rhizophila]|uniref:FAD-binding oxidoreductase n=1 Tax=Actinomycetospora rhizophila TaxID=1416876 RepID=A0ABV9ZP40_9PSEU